MRTAIDGWSMLLHISTETIFNICQSFTWATGYKFKTPRGQGKGVGEYAFSTNLQNFRKKSLFFPLHK